MLNTGTQEHPVASVDMTFKASSHKPVTCASGSETLYTGSLTGSYSLVTGLSGGGTVSGSGVTVPGAILTADNSCVTNTQANCLDQKGLSFASSSSPALFADGFSGYLGSTKSTFVGVSKTTELTAPAEASREDGGFIYTSVPTHAKKVLSITTSSAGLVTGSATISGGTSKTLSEPCSSSGKSYTVKSVEVENAKYASPAGSPISSTLSLGGLIAAPSPTSTASYVITTVTAG